MSAFIGAAARRPPCPLRQFVAARHASCFRMPAATPGPAWLLAANAIRPRVDGRFRQTTGATGLVGSRLVSRLASQGHSVRVLTRNVGAARGKLPYGRLEFYGPADWGEAFAGATAVVNLAGKATFRDGLKLCACLGSCMRLTNSPAGETARAHPAATWQRAGSKQCWLPGCGGDATAQHLQDGRVDVATTMVVTLFALAAHSTYTSSRPADPQCGNPLQPSTPASNF